VTEIRTALNDAMSALWLDELSFTEATLIPQVTAVKKAHIPELRDGVQ
jgi:hypothetical protein